MSTAPQKISLFILTALFFILASTPAFATIFIPGEEISSRPAGWTKTRDASHMIAVNTWSRTDPTLSLQKQIDAVKAKGGQVILPHPYSISTSVAPGFTTTQLKNLRGYMGVELTKLMNNIQYFGWDYGGTYSPLYYHYFSVNSSKVWGFRNPDNDYLVEEGLKSSILVRSASLSRSAIMESMKRGDFVALRTSRRASATLLKSFPFPAVDLVSNKITIVAPKGYSTRMYRAGSATPVTGTCSYTTKYAPVTRSDDACASDNYTTTFSYTPKGSEGYVKIHVINYADTYRTPNAIYQPIFVDNTGTITYNPYHPVAPVASNKYLGQIHIHTNNSIDNRDGPSPSQQMAWHVRHGFDFITVTDHNFITKDFVNPKPVAPYSATVAKDKYVRLYYKGTDRSMVKVTMYIKNKSTGRIVKTLYPGWKKPNTLLYTNYKASLARGYYSYGVKMTDSYRNRSATTAWNNLTIK